MPHLTIGGTHCVGNGQAAAYLRDGAVSESSCPYRPWESAINWCGILKLLEARR